MDLLIHKHEFNMTEADYFDNCDNEELLLRKLKLVRDSEQHTNIPPLLEPLRSCDTIDSDDNPDKFLMKSISVVQLSPDFEKPQSNRKKQKKSRERACSRDWVGVQIIISDETCVPIHEPLDDMDKPRSLNQYIEKTKAKQPATLHSRAVSTATPSTGILSMSSEDISNGDYSRLSISMDSCLSRTSQERRLYIENSRKMRPNSSGSVTSSSTKNSLTSESLSVQLSENEDFLSFLEENSFSNLGGALLSKMLRENTRLYLKRNLLRSEKELYSKVHQSGHDSGKLGSVCEDRSVYFAI